MVKWAILSLVGVTLATGVHAEQGQVCIRTNGGMSRVVAKVENPADCCNGRMQCSQFLSTTIVARPLVPQRT